LADLQDSMFREATNGFSKSHRTKSSRVNVTIFYHETPRTSKPKKETVKKRRNFRRDD
jgi:hypothetical protein